LRTCPYHLCTLYRFFLTIPPPPRPTLFPYTTLFRSRLPRARPRAPPRDAARHRRRMVRHRRGPSPPGPDPRALPYPRDDLDGARSEEHTSELQSRGHLVCRLLLEKKKKEGNVLDLDP